MKTVHQGMVFGLLLFSLPSCIFSFEEDPYRFVPSYGKTVTMTSVEGDHFESYATDGDYNTYEGTAMPIKFSQTFASNTPYLRLDLGSTIYITYVQFNVPDTKIDQFELALTVGDDLTVDSPSNHECFRGTISSQNTAMCWKYGRYVIVRKLIHEICLYMTEIAVQTLPIENLAHKKPADSENQFSSSFDPPKAVDMSVNTKLSTTLPTVPWLRVDLESEYFIFEVLLIPGSIGSAKKFHNVDLLIGNSLQNNGNNNPACFTNKTMYGGEIRSYYCKMFGRFVNVKRQKQQFDPIYVITLDITEVIVNPETTNDVATQRGADTDAELDQGYLTSLTDKNPNSCIRSVLTTAAKKIWVDLVQTYQVAKIYIINSGHTLLQFEDTKVYAGSSNDHTASTECITGEQYRKKAQRSIPFYCEPRVAARYVILYRGGNNARRISACEILVFEETKPQILEPPTEKLYMNTVPGSDVLLTCESHGYPVAKITWRKNDVVIGDDSNTLLISQVDSNKTGRYECWANNSHGIDAKSFNIQLKNQSLMCARYKEINVLPGKEQKEIKSVSDLWFKFYDSSLMKEMQIKSSKRSGNCAHYLKCSHPNFEQGVEVCDFCLRDNDCQQIYIRRCSSYYVYNLNAVKIDENICFGSVEDIVARNQPIIATPVKNYLLTQGILHEERGIVNYYECLTMCQLDVRCKSFNYSKNLKICQLSDATKNEFPEKVEMNNDYDHYMVKHGVMVKTEL